MKDKEAIRLLHDILQHKDKWYLDFNVLEIDEFDDVCEKACENADYALPSLSVSALYSRYRLWKQSEPILDCNKELFDCFLSDVAWDLGRRSLRGKEREIFEANYHLTIHFLS